MAPNKEMIHMDPSSPKFSPTLQRTDSVVDYTTTDETTFSPGTSHPKPINTTLPTLAHGTEYDKANTGTAQRLLTQINQTPDNTQKDIIRYGSSLNASLLADGVTPSERFVSTHSTSTSSIHASPSITQAKESKILDALIQKTKILVKSSKTPIPRVETQEHTTSYFKSYFNFFPKSYKFLLKKAASLLNKHVIKGIQGQDINNFLVAMSHVYKTKTPRRIHCKALTFPGFDPSYTLTDADIVLHEISTPDPSKGFKKIRVKASIQANIEYPSASGKMVKSTFNMQETVIELEFQHAHVIEKLLDSANIASTAITLIKSLTYAKLPGIPGWQHVKRWAGWENTKKAEFKESVESTPNITSMLMPKSVSIQDMTLNLKGHNQDAAEQNAELALHFDTLHYDATHSNSELSGENIACSFTGNHCVGLLPASIAQSTAQLVPQLQHGHTNVQLAIPKMTLKNKEEGTVIAASKIYARTQGDIRLDNGMATDVQLGFFKQSTGSHVMAVRASQLLCPHVVIPAQPIIIPKEDRFDGDSYAQPGASITVPGASFGLHTTEEGSLEAKNIQLTFIQSTDDTPNASNAELLGHIGQSVYRRVTGWVQRLSRLVPQKHVSDIASQKTRQITTFCAQEINADISGKNGVKVKGQFQHAGLVVDSQSGHLSLSTEKSRLEHLQLLQPLLHKSHTDHDAHAPILLQGEVDELHIHISPEKLNEKTPCCTIEATRPRGSLDATVVKIDRIDTPKLTVDVANPSLNDWHLLIKTGKSIEAALSSSETQVTANIKSQSATLNTHLLFDQNNTLSSITNHATTSELHAHVTPPPPGLPHQDIITTQAATLGDHIEVEHPEVTFNMQLGQDPKQLYDGVDVQFDASRVHTKGKTAVDFSFYDQQKLNETYTLLQKETEEKLQQAIQQQLGSYVMTPPNKPTAAAQEAEFHLEKPHVSIAHHPNGTNAKVTIPKISAQLQDAQSAMNIEVQIDDVEAHHTQSQKNKLQQIHIPNIDIVTTPSHKDDTTPTTHIHLNARNVTATKKASNESQRLRVHAHHANVTAKNTNHSPEKYLSVDELALEMQTRKDTMQFTAHTHHLQGKSPLLPNTSIELNNAGVSVSRIGTQTKIQHHIDHKNSHIRLNNLTVLLDLIRQKRTGQQVKTLPIDFELTPVFGEKDRLIHAINVDCSGDIGMLVQHYTSHMRSKPARLFASLLSYATSKLNFHVLVSNAPIQNNCIPLGQLMKHTHFTLEYRGMFAWLFKPLSYGLHWFTRGALYFSQVKLTQSGITNESGEISVKNLLEQYNIFLNRSERPLHVSRIGACNSPLNRVSTSAQLPIPWNASVFEKMILHELCNLYPHHRPPFEELFQIATTIRSQHPLPKTPAAIHTTFATLRALEVYQKMKLPDSQGPEQHCALAMQAIQLYQRTYQNTLYQCAMGIHHAKQPLMNYFLKATLHELNKIYQYDRSKQAECAHVAQAILKKSQSDNATQYAKNILTALSAIAHCHQQDDTSSPSAQYHQAQSILHSSPTTIKIGLPYSEDPADKVQLTNYLRKNKYKYSYQAHGTAAVKLHTFLCPDAYSRHLSEPQATKTVHRRLFMGKRHTKK